MENNYKVYLGQRLKLLRKDHNLTQENLAEKLGISVKHYSEVERGITGLSIENLIKVSNLFNVSLDYLLKGIVSNNAYPILYLYSTFSKSKQEKIIQLLELLRDFN